MLHWLLAVVPSWLARAEHETGQFVFAVFVTFDPLEGAQAAGAVVLLDDDETLLAYLRDLAGVTLRVLVSRATACSRPSA